MNESYHCARHSWVMLLEERRRNDSESTDQTYDLATREDLIARYHGDAKFVDAMIKDKIASMNFFPHPEAPTCPRRTLYVSWKSHTMSKRSIVEHFQKLTCAARLGKNAVARLTAPGAIFHGNMEPLQNFNIDVAIPKAPNPTRGGGAMADAAAAHAKLFETTASDSNSGTGPTQEPGQREKEKVVKKTVVTKEQDTTALGLAKLLAERTCREIGSAEALGLKLQTFGLADNIVQQLIKIAGTLKEHYKTIISLVKDKKNTEEDYKEVTAQLGVIRPELKTVTDLGMCVFRQLTAGPKNPKGAKKGKRNNATTE